MQPTDRTISSADLPRAGSAGTRLAPRLRPARMVTAAAVAVLAVGWLARYDATTRDPEASLAGRILPALDRTAARWGLGLDQVEVTGVRQASAAAILDAVDLGNVGSFLTFKTAQVKARIERLPWIATAHLERRWPNVLTIAVTERQPFAVWDRGSRDALIDATGRQLTLLQRGAVKNLPRIAGEDAPDDAGRLLGLVAGYPELAARLNLAERIGGRRWRLHLDGDLRLDLPAEADAAALASLFEARPAGRLLDLAASRIDLTSPRRVVVEPARKGS